MQQKLKSPFRMLRNFGHSKQGSKEAPAAIDEVPLPSVSNCMQNVLDMRDKYEGLLANGQIISGAAFDFARSLQDMASYMMESFGEVVDEELGNIFSLLSKVQFEMAELLRLFAAHVSEAIIKPTELLMKNIQQAEVMKNEYDKERKLYVLSLMHKKTSKVKRGRGSLGDKKDVMDEKILQEKVDHLTSYMKSLEHEQLENLITQGVRYHSAHMHLFSKGFGSINTVEPMIRQVALNRMIDTTVSLEDTSINHLVNLEMETKENAQKRDYHSDSPGSSPKHLLVEQTEPTYFSDSSEEFQQRRPVITTQSAPISPLRNHRIEARDNAQVPILDTEHESVTMYVLPSPVNENSGVIGIKAIKKLEKHLDLLSEQVKKSRGGNLDAFRVKPKPDILANGLSPTKKQFVRIQQQDHPRTPNKDSNLFVDYYKNDDSVYKVTEEKGRRYAQSAPLIESPTSIKHPSQNDKAPSSFYEEFIPPLYKSGPIHKSPLFCGTIPDFSPPSPSRPHISELHKLPLPPPGYVTPPKSPNNTPMTITHSAPLGQVMHMDGGNSIQITPLSSSPSIMTRSLSIPTPIIQLED